MTLVLTYQRLSLECATFLHGLLSVLNQSTCLNHLSLEKKLRECLATVLKADLCPVLTAFDGTIYHGTGTAAYEALLAERAWRFGSNETAWLGPAAYGFENMKPYNCPHLGLDGPANFGTWAACLHAEVKISKNLCDPPPQVLPLSLTLDRVFDLESEANDEFVSAVRRLFTPLYPEMTPAQMGEVERPAFVGKLVRAHLDLFGQTELPEAFQLSFPVGNHEAMQRGLAVIDEFVLSRSLSCIKF